MARKAKEQFKGLFPGPYTISGESRDTIRVVGKDDDGEVLVGRFPITSVADARAQAEAYAALWEMIDALKLAAQSTDPAIRYSAVEALTTAGVRL